MVTIKKAKKLILDKADEIRDTIDRSGFCKPDCEGCLRAKAKTLVDEDLGIDISKGEMMRFIWTGRATLETPTDKALRQLAV